MAHGDRAERRGHNRDYWSRRPGGPRCLPWGAYSKHLTHRAERRASRALVQRELEADQQDMLLDWQARLHWFLNEDGEGYDTWQDYV